MQQLRQNLLEHGPGAEEKLLVDSARNMIDFACAMIMLVTPIDFPLQTQLEVLRSIHKWPVGTPRANIAMLLKAPPRESIVASYMTYIVKEKDLAPEHADVLA